MEESAAIFSPWEHHASAAGLPRFIYNPLTKPFFKGFLVTCTLDREKSATKEAIDILNKYLESPHTEEDDNISKKKKTGNEGAESGIRKGASEAYIRGSVESSTTHVSSINQLSLDHMNDSCQPKNVANLKRTHAHTKDAGDWSRTFLLKMAQKGIIAVCWENSILEDPVDVLAKVLKDMEDGVTATPRWCQRMVPIQSSCIFSRESLTALVMKLVKEHLGDMVPTEERPVKFAISYNKRGADSSEVDGHHVSGDSEALNRVTCIQLVAEAVASTAMHTAVDLRAPQMVVIVEVIPVAGIEGSSPVCGVAVVSGMLMNTKPRLCVRPLVSASQRSQLAKCCNGHAKA